MQVLFTSEFLLGGVNDVLNHRRFLLGGVNEVLNHRRFLLTEANEEGSKPIFLEKIYALCRVRTFLLQAL